VPGGQFFWWMVSWGINVVWIGVAVATSDILVGVGAGIYTIILIVWQLPGTSSDDDETS